MILYYAPGGGLGHLTRARALVHTLGLQEPVAVVAAGPHADDPRITGGWHIIRPSLHLAQRPTELRRWLEGLLAELRPSAVFLDAFPGGILGEWCDLSLHAELPVLHVARLLNWERYAARLAGTLPAFHATYVTEPLTEAQATALRRHSRHWWPLELQDPPSEIPVESLQRLPQTERPLWLVVHSGPAAETAELLAYARDMARAEHANARLVLVSPQPPADSQLIHLDLYPSAPLYYRVDRLISACGFNMMRQARGLDERHRFLPMPRPLDDQFLRAARRRAGEC